MTKPKSRAKAAARSTARKTPKAAPRKRSVPVSSKPAGVPNTKQARVIAMLRAPAGATIASLMVVTDWQQHSVRGFFAGVVRKKLGLNLVSEKIDGERTYPIVSGRSDRTATKSGR